jgi:hypothetical protein
MCQTNPISPRWKRGGRAGVSGAKSQVPSQEGPISRPPTSDFTLLHGKLCRTKPNLEGMGCMGKGSCRLGRAGRRVNAQNKPNFGVGSPTIADCGLRI